MKSVTNALANNILMREVYLGGSRNPGWVVFSTILQILHSLLEKLHLCVHQPNNETADNVMISSEHALRTTS